MMNISPPGYSLLGSVKGNKKVFSFFLYYFFPGSFDNVLFMCCLLIFNFFSIHDGFFFLFSKEFLC